MPSNEKRGSIELKTDRLILRRFQPSDAESIYNNWANDPEVAEHLTWQAHADISVSQSVLDSWLGGYDSSDFYQWGIELAGELIGSIGCKGPDPELNSIEVGYAIGRRYWGHGYMTEALGAVIDYLFAEGNNRVWAYHDLDNPASERVLEKSGMIFEGIVRDGAVDNVGNYRDVKQWAILRRDR